MEVGRRRRGGSGWEVLLAGRGLICFQRWMSSGSIARDQSLSSGVPGICLHTLVETLTPHKAAIPTSVPKPHQRALASEGAYNLVAFTWPQCGVYKFHSPWTDPSPLGPILARQPKERGAHWPSSPSERNSWAASWVVLLRNMWCPAWRESLSTAVPVRTGDL